MTLDTIRMDGFWGALLAAESVRGCGAVLHGPGGCRSMLDGESSRFIIRRFAIDEGPFYFNQPRIPCTYLDEEDYINGADYKLSDLLSTMSEEVAFVVQSPGTSLIGDYINGAAHRSNFQGTVIVQKENHMSEPFHIGYDAATSELVDRLCVQKDRKTSKVIVLGIPISMDGWEETVSELDSYIAAMELEAVFVGSGCSVQDIVNSGDASICITVLPEYCTRTSEAYLRHGIPTINGGIPIGFDGTSRWIENLAKAVGADPDRALEILNRSSERASTILRSAMTSGLAMRCATYSMDLDSIATLPLAKWLYEYLAMFPEEIAVMPWWDKDYLDEFKEFLTGIRSESALVDGLTPKRCDVMFAGGQSAALMRKNDVCSVDIAVLGPSTHLLRFVGRPFLGAKGAMLMLDRMFELRERD
ncbi:nitrogenase component 1 [Candidatus Methanoprimaticola sp. MG2]|uniref:nitrogenase component 1 n=1 Tax=Candidatus Methanoprimaticola sp. MG2 TaxID=3228838 RepID=UPI0039C64629